MVKVQRCVGLAAAVLGLWGAALGCGDDGAPPSFGSIAKELEKPTGTVDESTATKVGEKFEAANQNRVGFGVREDNQVAQSGSATVEQSCPAGGSYSATARGSGSSGNVTIDYDDCCYTAGCCASGRGTMYYNSESAGAADAYSFCASFDMDYACGESSAVLEYSGCYGLAGGEAVLLVEVDGESFAVSGTRSGGSGTLEIRGANGTWECTYTANSGSCTSSSGGTFSFSSSAD